MTSLARQTLVLTNNLRPNTTHTGTRIQAAMFAKIRAPSLWATITSSLKPSPTGSITNAPEKPRLLPSRSFESIETGRPVEEEELPDYQVDRFYPMQLGEVF